MDTDAYNEIDDQFAIAYLLHAPEKANVKAIYAAPFFNTRCDSPGDGMEKSHEEIIRLLRLMNRPDVEPLVHRGSEGYLPDEHTPVDSPAARDLAQRAAGYSPDKPLYVLAIGAITNVASALLMNPAIGKNMVVVWLGGHALHWPHNKEFNIFQDVAAARVVFGSDAALILAPCKGGVDQLRTTRPELEHWLKGKNPLCDYLCSNTITEAESYAAGTPWSRVIWDIAVVAWLLDEEGRWLHEYLTPTPIPQYDHRYSKDPTRPLMRYISSIDRDAVFGDLFGRLTKQENQRRS